jgi:hypothetical protein
MKYPIGAFGQIVEIAGGFQTTPFLGWLTEPVVAVNGLSEIPRKSLVFDEILVKKGPNPVSGPMKSRETALTSHLASRIARYSCNLDVGRQELSGKDRAAETGTMTNTMTNGIDRTGD